MEKLYMQDSQDVKKQKQKRGLQQKVDFSVALSVIVAAFALFSIGAFGIINNQESTVSYAAPAEGFKMVRPSGDDYTAIYGYAEGDDDALVVPLYYADSVSNSNRVFCIEMRKAGGSGSNYSVTNDFANTYGKDAGLLYILQNSMVAGKKITSYTDKHEAEIEAWATQAAIWIYLADKYSSNQNNQFYTHDPNNSRRDGNDPDATYLDTVEGATNAVHFVLKGGPSSEPTQDISANKVATEVAALVKTAKGITDITSTYKVDVSATGELSQTQDKKFYQTGLISVVGTPSDSFASYDIAVKGMNGTKVVDQSGKDLALTNVPAGTKFFVRIPATAVKQEKQTIDVAINGHFKTKKSVFYVSENEGEQRVVSLGDDTLDKPSGISFDIIGSPDTGMNAAQTIYFIGLIVLLCGVGIVYANTKPVESKQ